MPFSWDREYDFNGASARPDTSKIVMMEPPDPLDPEDDDVDEDDDDENDLGTYGSDFDPEDDDDDDFDDEETDDGYGDDASTKTEDQPLFSTEWVGPSGKAWKVDFYDESEDE